MKMVWEKTKRFIDRLSYPTVLVILLLDMLEFKVFAITFGLSAPLSTSLAGVIGFFLVLIIQKLYTKIKLSQAISDAFISGLLIAIPFPIATSIILGTKLVWAIQQQGAYTR